MLSPICVLELPLLIILSIFAFCIACIRCQCFSIILIYHSQKPDHRISIISNTISPTIIITITIEQSKIRIMKR